MASSFVLFESAYNSLLSFGRIYPEESISINRFQFLVTASDSVQSGLYSITADILDCCTSFAMTSFAGLSQTKNGGVTAVVKIIIFRFESHL